MTGASSVAVDPDEGADHGPTADARAATLAAWQRRVTVPLVLAALLPLLGGDRDVATTTAGALVAFVCWGVFVADLVVHTRFEHRYLSSTNGRVDLAIVVLTFPWAVVFPDLQATGVLQLARLARVVRIGYVAARSVEQIRLLVARLGKAMLYATILSAACVLTVSLVEPPSSGYAIYGDALWWSAVTITTVGYGDLAPVTVVGRLTAVLLMIAGLGLLGTLAGSLAAFFRLDDEAVEEARAGAIGTGRLETEAPDLRAELVHLRGELDAVVARLGQDGSHA